MQLCIRPAQPRDAASLAEIGARTFALACPPGTAAADLQAYIDSELTPQRFREHLGSPATSLYTAEIDEAAAGYLMLCREPWPPQVRATRPLSLRRLYVLDRYHGSGVALALMGEAFVQARDGGHDALWLSVSRHNARGLAFYRKTGFAVVGEQTFAVGQDLHEDYIMARSLAETAA